MTLIPGDKSARIFHSSGYIAFMVVKHEKSVEGIRDSLRRLERFFSESQAHNTDKRTLATIQHDLVKIEGQLCMFSETYRKSMNEDVKCSAS